ncbi:MAG TPA: creatininase family protein [Thermomicrobiales bacterium]|nr:creatininase family protein [Thermomicrobiales bacterium]
MAVRRWNEMNRRTLAKILPGAVTVVPTAATEQHGPHLATGHDALILDEIVRRAGDCVASDIDVVVTPTLAFGSSDHHLPFGGTLSLGTETYLRVISDLLRSLVAAGTKRILVVNGHGGNHELNEIAVRDVAISLPAGQHVKMAAGSWWTIAAGTRANDARFAGIRTPGHAGALETAMMLAFRPELVAADRPARENDPSLGTVIPGARIEGEVRWADFDGYTDSPALATAELGEAALAIAADALAGAIATLAYATVE